MPRRPTSQSLRPTTIAMERAKSLRKRMSPPERILWSLLRDAQLGGLTFRRQHPIGPFIADFYCAAASLVVEVDGGNVHHGEQSQRDDRRDKWMRERRLAVVRVSASDVTKNVLAVGEHVLRVARRRVMELEKEGSQPE